MEESVERVKRYLKNFEGDKKDFEAILDVLNEYTESKSDKEIETSDKNVANIEKDVELVKRYLENSAYKESNSDFFKNGGWEIVDLEIPRAMQNILSEREQDKKRIQELEEENKKLKASHIFTRNNNATDEEKAKLYDVIDNTIDTFLEQKNQKWEQIMTTNKMSVDEAIDIVDKMYQDRYKAIEKDDTILVNKLDDIKFTNLEFASVILLREVQSLQSNLENSIPKQKVKEILDDIYDYFERLNGPDEDIEYIENKRKELLEE